MGLMGENGAGKYSTMMKCLFGTYQKDEEGKITLDGREVSFSRAERCSGKRNCHGSSGVEPVSGKKCYG